MHRIIFDEFRGYTVVMVAHRLDVVVEDCDTVVVMDKGSLAERGDPRELVKGQRGLFWELWKESGREREEEKENM